MKKRVGKILFWLCIVVCVLGLAYIAIYYFRKDKNEDVYQKVQKASGRKKTGRRRKRMRFQLILRH